jgi:hypothetical protein
VFVHEEGGIRRPHRDQIKGSLGDGRRRARSDQGGEQLIALLPDRQAVLSDQIHRRLTGAR